MKKILINVIWRMNIVIIIFGLLHIAIPMCLLAEEQNGDYVLEDTVVTATKTGETKLQETAISISAFDYEALKAGGVEDLIDIQKKTPNMSLFATGPSQTMVYIRGIGNNGQYVGGNESVGLYVDDVYNSRYSGFWASYLDVENIEVLRGPQGTLYGRNTSGGAIRIMTKKPTDELSGYLNTEYGFTKEKISTEGAIGGPIVENIVKFRFAFLKSKSDGAIDNIASIGPDTVDHESQIATRGKIQYTPSEKIDILITGDYSEQKAGNGHYAPSNLQPFIDAGHPNYDLGHEVAINNLPDDSYDDTCEGLSADININLSREISFRSITAYREAESNYPWIDLDGTMFELMNLTGFMKIRQCSQEFQFNADWGKFNIVSGLYYINEYEYNLNTTRIWLPFPYEVLRNVGLKTDSWAAFTSWTYKLNDRMNVTAGLRYTYEERKINIDNNARYDLGAITGSSNSQWIESPYENTDKDDWTDISPKLGIDYRISDEAFLFASITRGFKGGGFNGTAASYEPPFDEEVVWSYEVGAKTDWLNNRLRINATLFYYDYEDLQLRKMLFTDEGYAGTWISNAAESTVYGGELELLARPIPPLTLGMNIAYTNSKYDEYLGGNLDNEPIDLSGNQLMNSPEWTLNCFARYSIKFKNYGFITLYADYDWKDEVFTDPLNDDLRKLDDLGLLNTLISFETENGKWGVEFYGKNLTDETYMTAHWYIKNLLHTSPSSKMTLGPYGQDARRFGVRLIYRF